MYDLGNIKGLPELKEGRAVVLAGSTIQAAAHFAAMTYVSQFVLQSNRVTVDSDKNGVKQIYDAVARGYMQVAKIPIKYPIDQAKIEDAWDRISFIYRSPQIERVSMITMHTSNVIVHVPTSTIGERHVIEDAVAINKSCSINKTIHLMCVSRDTVQHAGIQNTAIIEINDTMSLISVYTTSGQLERTIPVKYYGGVLTNA